MAEYTPEAEVEAAYNTLQATFRSGKTKEIAWRKWQLKQLWWMIEENEQRIVEALHKDMNKPVFETTFTESMTIKTDIVEHLKNIDKWTAERPTDTPLAMKAVLRPTIRPEPLGVALIIGPWNFPISLVLQPMIAAITAGCAVMLKPSEVTQAAQALLVDLIPKYMDPSAIRIVTGGPAETGSLIARKWDHIFFTGSVNVARYVAAAAAKNLTPTVLELGGQCPAIVTKTADVETAARQIAWAKFLNSGQICLTVNHVFAHPDVEKKLIERMTFYFNEFKKGKTSEMTHIVNDKNFERLKALLEKTDGKVECGGELDASTRCITPSVVSNVTMKDSLLSEELFGTICPVLRSSTDEAIESINSLSRPLAIYIFSKDQKEIDKVISSTISGGVTVNGVLIHAAVPGAPFGGVGDSGHGSYHGDYGFRSFSHMRVIARPTSVFSKVSSFLLPPYSPDRVKWFAVRNSLGIKRNWTLDDERRECSKGVIWKSASRVLKLLVVIITLGLVVSKLQGRLGLVSAFNNLIGLLKGK
jgi:aldehyde dehydrogenase (NAD+)